MCHKNGLKWISSALMFEQLKGKIFPYGTSSRLCTWLVYFICRHPRNRDPADKKKGPRCERSQPPLWCFSHVGVEGLPPWSALTAVPTFFIGMECAEAAAAVCSGLDLLLTQVFLAGPSPIIKTGRSAALTESQKSPFTRTWTSVWVPRSLSGKVKYKCQAEGSIFGCSKCASDLTDPLSPHFKGSIVMLAAWLGWNHPSGVLNYVHI